ncbi:MAG: PRC-barrel domain-containing protein [Pseudomonadota bacterium]
MVLATISISHAGSELEPEPRTTGAIAVDQEGSGMTSAASANVETVRNGTAVTPLTDQMPEGTDTDIADLDDGTVIDNPQTPAEALIEDGEVETDVAASPSMASDVQPTSYSGLTPPDVQRDGYAPVIVNEITAGEMTNAAVFNTADERLGEIGSLTMGADGTPEGAVIDVGGFLGLGETAVDVPLDSLTILKSETDMRVYIDATAEQLESFRRQDG